MVSEFAMYQTLTSLGSAGLGFAILLFGVWGFGVECSGV